MRRPASRPPADAAERLQKVLAAVWRRVASGERVADRQRPRHGRRQAGPARHAGRPGQRSIIAVDGRVIGGARRPTYLLLHKPAGVTSTVRDRHASTTVLDMIPTALAPRRRAPVPGRPARPGFRGPARPDQRRRMGRPGAPSAARDRARIRDRPAGAADRRAGRCPRGRDPARRGARDADRSSPHDRDRDAPAGRAPRPAARRPVWYRAILAQGWKRQLRRMFGAVGAPIDRLVRVRIGPVRLDDLASGRARRLRAPEVRGLGAGAGTSRAGARGAQPAPRAGPGRTPSRRPAPRRRQRQRPAHRHAGHQLASPNDRHDAPLEHPPDRRSGRSARRAAAYDHGRGRPDRGSIGRGALATLRPMPLIDRAA